MAEGTIKVSDALPTVNCARANSKINNRVSEQIVSMNFYDANNSGLAIDFNFQQSQITVYKVVNGSAVGTKRVTLT